MSLREALREPPAALRVRLESSGVSRDSLDAARADLVSTLEASGTPAAPREARSGRAWAAAVARLGEVLEVLDEEGALGANPEEMLAVHGWVRSRLLACVLEVESEPAVPASRDVALRKSLATADILFIEFDHELRVRWTPDFDRPPFDSTSVGRQVEEFLAPTDGGQFLATLRRVLATGVSERAELTIHPRVPLGSLDEGPLEFVAAVEPTRDASGAIVGVLCASTNVTELKRTQGALREAVRIRDLMLAVLAHDLRNPLTTVRALASTYARNDALPEKVRRGLGQVESAARRMDELIGTLLDFSAARAGGSIPVVRFRCNAQAVVLAVVEELRQTRPDRQITLDAVGDCRAELDAPRMAQVVSNLVGNALTHGSPSEPVRVAIDGRGPDLMLTVQNAGRAIPATLLPVLFEPFRRGEDKEAHPRGLGLGLYITHEIVRAHQGTIEVHSTEERGTVFTVRLPRGETDTPPGA